MIALSGWRINKVAQEVPHVVGRGLRWPLGRARTLIGDERILRTRAPQPGSTGRARYWVRTNVPLLDEPVSTTATAAGLLDIANGMTVRANPSDVAFPNIDLTAHLFRQPRAGWLGFDTTITFGPSGHGLTRSTLHDEAGPIGTLAQTLTVRPTHR